MKENKKLWATLSNVDGTVERNSGFKNFTITEIMILVIIIG